MASMQVENQERQQLDAMLNNQTPMKIHADRYIKWPNLLGPMLPTIDAHTEVPFNLFVPKGAVVYSGPNIYGNGMPGSSPSWVVAWDTTAETLLPPSRNKVYVTCGSTCDIAKMTDDEILKKLNESTSPYGSHTDPISNTTVSASLRKLLPNEFLQANFGLIKE